MVVMHITVYNRNDEFVRTIPESQLLVFVHTDELNGADSVQISTLSPLYQGERLVWVDSLGVAHEHVCQNPKATRELGVPIYSDTALNSICDMFGDIIEDYNASEQSLGVAFQHVIGTTRFEGACTATGKMPAKTDFSGKSARECLRECLKVAGELETRIEVTGGKVTRRICNITPRRGHTSSHKRFTYGKDLTKIERTEHSSVITACYGYGKQLESEGKDDAPKKKLTVFVEDKEARRTYGLAGRNITGTYENSQCDSPVQLEDETRGYLKAHSKPQVTYEADVVDLAAMGKAWEGVEVGDPVDIVDTAFKPALRCRGRVLKIVRNALTNTATVTLGNITETLADQYMTEREHLQNLQKTIDNLGEPDPRNDAYLQKLIEGLNEKFNENGANYYHIDFKHGSTWASVPMDEDGNPTRDGGWAINIGSLGFRIASKRKADGSWDWSTFGTGEGFTANSIVSGSLDARLIRAGVITDRAGKNHWDLDTGEFYTRDARADNMHAYNMSAWDMSAYGHLTVSSGRSQIDLYDGRIDARLGGESFGYIQLADQSRGRGIRMVANEQISLYAPHVYMGVSDEWHAPVEGVTDYATFVSWIDFANKTYATKQIHCQKGIVTSLS